MLPKHKLEEIINLNLKGILTEKIQGAVSVNASVFHENFSYW